MKKEYIKPIMEISDVEMGDCLMFETSITPVNPEWGMDGKRREELWVEDVDLWGNESWTRVDM